MGRVLVLRSAAGAHCGDAWHRHAQPFEPDVARRYLWRAIRLRDGNGCRDRRHAHAAPHGKTLRRRTATGLSVRRGVRDVAARDLRACGTCLLRASGHMDGLRLHARLSFKVEFGSAPHRWYGVASMLDLRVVTACLPAYAHCGLLCCRIALLSRAMPRFALPSLQSRTWSPLHSRCSTQQMVTQPCSVAGFRSRSCIFSLRRLVRLRCTRLYMGSPNSSAPRLLDTCYGLAWSLTLLYNKHYIRWRTMAECLEYNSRPPPPYA